MINKPESEIWTDGMSVYVVPETGIDEAHGYYRYLRADKVEREIDNYKMLLEEANKQIATLKERDRLNTDMIASMTDQLDASLPADKVRELVISAISTFLFKHGGIISHDTFPFHDHTKCRLCQTIRIFSEALFPEGLESEVKDE